MLSKTQWWIIGGVGALVITIVTILVIKGKKTNMNTNDDNNNDADKNVDKTKNYIIGDSQTPIIDRNSKKATLINKTGSEKSLWKGGMGLKWLKDAVTKYPVSNDVKNVVINIGTNGGFNANEDIAGLINELKRVFAKSKFYVVKGSWGWGGNKSITEQKVNAYYDKFKNNGVTVLQTAIGSVTDPHGNLPIYKQIGKEIDNQIN